MSARQWRRILLIALFGIGQCVFLFAYVFVVRFVKVEGNVNVPSSTIVKEASLQVGEYYWSYLLQGIPQRVKSLPYLESASLKLLPGGVVSIAVQEFPAVAQVATGNAKSPWAAVTADGYVLGPVKDNNSALPKVNAYHTIPLSGRLPQEVVNDLMLVHPICSELFGADLVSYSFDASERVAVQFILLGHHTNVLLGEAQTLEEKVPLLRALLANLRQKGAPVKQIDVRFRNAVVTLVAPPSPSPTPSPTPEPTPEEAVSDDVDVPEGVEVEYYQEGEADIAEDNGGGYADETYDSAPSESSSESESAEGANYYPETEMSSESAEGADYYPETETPSDSGAY